MKLNAVAFLVTALLGLWGAFKLPNGSIGETIATVFAIFFFLVAFVCFIWPEKKNQPVQMARKPKSRKGWSR